MDATFTDGLGRYVNDSSNRHANCMLKALMFHGQPHLCLKATKSIKKGTEIRYNYGVSSLWWRKQTQYTKPFTIACIKVKFNLNSPLWLSE